MNGVSEKDYKKYFVLKEKEAKKCIEIIVHPPSSPSSSSSSDSSHSSSSSSVSTLIDDHYIEKRTEIKLTRKSDKRHLGWQAVAGEIVIHIRPKKGRDAAENLENDPALSLVLRSGNEGSNESQAELSTKLKRVLRQAILTLGTLQLVAMNKTFFKKYESLSRDCPNIVYGIRNLTSIACVGEDKNIIVLRANVDDLDNEQVVAKKAVYQSPFPERFLHHVSIVVARSFAGDPNWSLPLQWNLGFNLPCIEPHLVKSAVGLDGGFSHSFYAAMEPFLIHTTEASCAAEARTNMRNGPTHVYNTIQKLSGKKPWEVSANSIDIGKVAKIYGSAKNSQHLVIEAIKCLKFNLTYRCLNLRKFKPSSLFLKQKLHSSLSDIALYNVTLREIDLTGTNLQGAGVMLGKSWGMNPHPFISRISLNSCNLSNQDFRGLMPGLLRIWCGRSALLEKLDLGNNLNVSVLTWSLFFDTLVDPASFPLWPSQTPPPYPPLDYLQYLDVRGTHAISSSLSRFVSRLTGLRWVGIEGGLGTAVCEKDVLDSLRLCGSRLQTFKGKNLNCGPTLTDSLMQHCETLRAVELNRLSGDAVHLLCGWPKDVPRLSLHLCGDMTSMNALPSIPSIALSPGTVSIDAGTYKHNYFYKDALKLLCLGSSTHTLELRGFYLFELSDAAMSLASNGLKKLSVHGSQRKGVALSSSDTNKFWTLLATSKTLESITLTNQFYDDDAGSFEHLGDFLKVNRSVRIVTLHEPNFTLTVEGVGKLRSAFYGNRKVIKLDLPESAKTKAMENHRRTTQQNIAEVQECKRTIKQIFKRHYSKYDRNWRDTPNRLKIPYVERIRVAQRNIGSSKRAMEKIGKQLDEIGTCIRVNKSQFDEKSSAKKGAKLESKSNELRNISVKKQKILQKLVTKLHKSKARSQKRKRIPRTAYYKTNSLWQPSYYRPGYYYGHNYWIGTDPYYCRYHPWYGFYGSQWNQDEYLNNDQFGLEDINEPGSECAGSERESDGGEGSGMGDQFMKAPMAIEGLSSGIEYWDRIAPPAEDLGIISNDPWQGIDTLINGADSNLATALTAEHLHELHSEAAELGTDVVSDIAPVIEQAADMGGKIDSIAESVGIDASDVNQLVSNQMAQDGFQVSDVVRSFEPIESTNYDLEDDAVEMYAGAGPRDLDDGGPCNGSSSSPILSGRRNHRGFKKWKNLLKSVKHDISKPLPGYSTFSYPVFDSGSFENDLGESLFIDWSTKQEDHWKHEAVSIQIDVMSKSESFPYPEVSDQKGIQVLEWSLPRNKNMLPIEVVLVTQCTTDRISNLNAQLKNWGGKASVAVFVKSNEKMSDAINNVVSCVQSAKQYSASYNGGGVGRGLDVSCIMFQEVSESSPYPINFLRNMALIQAKKQQMSQKTIGVGAVMLVDVDFRPSHNLHELLHRGEAARTIIDEKKVVVCPAFEVKCPSAFEVPLDIQSLKQCVSDGFAEGFHLSHFPQGHGPTRFDHFWELSDSDNDACGKWEKLYHVPYEKNYEPYVVMATADVPLYDERFQGYGLNKVSHIASIAKQIGDPRQSGQCVFSVLPGAFLIAPVHQRSTSWYSIYGSSNHDAKYNKLWLKGLYANFNQRLVNGEEPCVSSRTESLQQELLQKRVIERNFGKDDSPLHTIPDGLPRLVNEINAVVLEYLDVCQSDPISSLPCQSSI